MMLLLRRSASARQIRYASRGPSAAPALLIAVKVPISTTGARDNASVENGRTSKRGYDLLTSAMIRSCINRVAVDWAPLMPSISGSTTNSILSLPAGRAAFENRSFDARSRASSNGVGGGGGGFGADCAPATGGAPCGKTATTPASKQQITHATRFDVRASSVTYRLQFARVLSIMPW